jgi:PAS domain S-box-containing protein
MSFNTTSINKNRLQYSEALFRTLFESSRDAIIILDENGFIDCNDATLALFGCSDKQTFCSMPSSNLSPLSQPSGLSSIMLADQQLSQALKDGSNIYEWTHKRIDNNELFSAEVLLSRIMIDGKKLVQATVRNISERKQAEQEASLHYSIENILQKLLLSFLNFSDFDSTIREALKELGIFTSSERAYAFQISSLNSIPETIYEWYSSASKTLTETFSSFALSTLPYPLRRLKKNEIILIEDISRTTEIDDLNKRFFLSRNIHGILLLPLYAKNTLIGLAGFDNPDKVFIWPESTYEFFRLLSQVISSVFERRIAELDLKNTNVQLISNEQQLRAINFQLSSSEDHLRIAQNKLARAMDVGKLALWSMYVSSETLEFDERKAVMLGYEPEEFKNMQFNDFLKYIHIEDRDTVRKALENHLNGLTDSYNVEYRILRADQTYSWFNDRGEISFRKLNGTPVQITGISIDISTTKQTKEMLEESEKRLSGIVNTIDDVVWSIDMSSVMKIIYLSPAVKKVYGREFEEFKNNSNLWIQCIHPEDRSTMADSYLQLKSNDNFDSERRIILPDGSIRWVRDRGWNIYDSTCNVIRIDGIVSDITNRKMAENALRESEVLFRAIVENSHNAICILNEYGKISWVNNRMVEISGYSRGQLLESESFYVFIAPDSLNIVKMNFQNYLSGLPYEPTYCFQYIRSDGKKRTVEKHMVGYTDKYGKRKLIISMLDITELKQAEENLKEGEARWRSYVEHAPYGVIISDKDGNFLQVNPQACKITGYSSEELIKIRFNDLLAFDLHKEDLKVIDTLVLKGEYHGELKFFHKSGEKRWWTVAGVYIADNKYVVFTNDITTRKIAEEEHLRLEAQLRHSQKMDSIGELAAGIAHEINNPIGFVLGNSETIIEYVKALKDFISLYGKDLSPDSIKLERKKLDIDYIVDDIDNLLDDNLSGLNRVKEIVSNLKDFARIDAAQFTETDIEDNIRKTLAIAKSELKYNIDVHTSFRSVSHVYCNPGEINQVFLNIIINAAQAIKEQKRTTKGNITISTSEDVSSIYCEISDDGPGIPDNIQTRIFEPFFTTKDVGKGTGLGLSIAYDIIVNKHNGTLNVKSESGNGASFRIQIPKLLKNKS